MNLDYTAVVASLETHAMGLGVFDTVNDHEPVGSPPGTGLHAGIWIDDIGPEAGFSGLNVTSARLEVMVRIYEGVQALPSGGIETSILNATNLLMAAYSAAFTLEGNTSYVDLMRLRGKAGWVHVGDQTYRAMTITLPMVFEDVWTQTA